MKKYFLAFALLIGLTMIGCKERAYIDGPGDNKYNLDSIPVMKADTNGIEISVDSAIAICKALAPDAVTGEVYKITGVVTKNGTSPMLVPSSYTNVNFDIKGINGSSATLNCYHTNNINNRAFRRSNDVPRTGSIVTVMGPLTNYNGTAELKEGFIVRIDSMVAPGPFPGCPDPAEGEISVSQAVAIAQGLEMKKPTEQTYDIMGVVTEILEFSASNGNATYIISDGKQYFEIYRGKGIENKNFTNANQIMPNDTVTVRAKIQNYNGTYETSGNAPLVKTTNPNH